MRKFNFTVEEINAHKHSPEDWHKFVRKREAEIVFSLFPDTKFPLALELGAGDGGQSIIIAKHCQRLICTELNEKILMDRKLPNVEYLVCDAQDLSQFGDKSFDLIFSSNVLEHIPDIHRCLSECNRVLRDDGIMLHTIPSRWWKVFCFSLAFVKLRIPKVHGVSSNHVAEFFALGYKTWITEFETNGFKVDETVALPFYVGHRNFFIPITKAGNLMHLPASYLYVVRKR